MPLRQLSSKVLVVAIVAFFVLVAAVVIIFSIAIFSDNPVPADRLAMLLRSLPPHFA